MVLDWPVGWIGDVVLCAKLMLRKQRGKGSVVDLRRVARQGMQEMSVGMTKKRKLCAWEEK